MNVIIFSTKAYENKSNWTLGENKPNSNPIAERVKLMQSVYLQRIMMKYAAMGYEKTKPKQTQFKPNFLKGQNELKIACRKIWPHPISITRGIVNCKYGVGRVYCTK